MLGRRRVIVVNHATVNFGRFSRLTVGYGSHWLSLPTDIANQSDHRDNRPQQLVGQRPHPEESDRLQDNGSDCRLYAKKYPAISVVLP